MSTNASTLPGNGSNQSTPLLQPPSHTIPIAVSTVERKLTAVITPPPPHTPSLHNTTTNLNHNISNASNGRKRTHAEISEFLNRGDIISITDKYHKAEVLISQHGWTNKDAAKAINVSDSALCKRRKRGVMFPTQRAHRPTFLTSEEVDDLRLLLMQAHQQKRCLIPREVLKLVRDLIAEKRRKQGPHDTPLPRSTPSYQWLNGFLKRHANIFQVVSVTEWERCSCHYDERSEDYQNRKQNFFYVLSDICRTLEINPGLRFVCDELPMLWKQRSYRKKRSLGSEIAQEQAERANNTDATLPSRIRVIAPSSIDSNNDYCNNVVRFFGNDPASSVSFLYMVNELGYSFKPIALTASNISPAFTPQQKEFLTNKVMLREQRSNSNVGSQHNDGQRFGLGMININQQCHATSLLSDVFVQLVNDWIIPSIAAYRTAHSIPTDDVALVMVDNHNSRFNEDTLVALNEAYIILVAFPSHATTALSPLSPIFSQINNSFRTPYILCRDMNMLASDSLSYILILG